MIYMHIFKNGKSQCGILIIINKHVRSSYLFGNKSMCTFNLFIACGFNFNVFENQYNTYYKQTAILIQKIINDFTIRMSKITIINFCCFQKCYFI